MVGLFRCRNINRVFLPIILDSFTITFVVFRIAAKSLDPLQEKIQTVTVFRTP